MAGETPHDRTTPDTKTDEKLDRLHELIEGIEVAMLTTRRPDGLLVSRPMQTQAKRAHGADLWFVTDRETNKLDELASDPHVNLAYYRHRTREWVSVSGRARTTQDRAIVRELWDPSWRAWFGDEGGGRDGGPDDPRIVLIAVDALSVVYMTSDRSLPATLFEVAKGIVTGKRPDVGDVRRVDERELHRGVRREPRL